MSEYTNKLIVKPWGSEYLLYENENVAIWKLFIKEGESTSLHAHPNKKTGLINISGKGELSFLNDKRPLNFFDKVMIRHGVFHATRAVTDLELLEIETPNNKGDLVRIRDKYGRVGQPYEAINPYNQFSVADIYSLLYIGKVNIEYWNLNQNSDFYNLPKEGKFMFLEGGIKSGNDYVCSAGDVIDSNTLSILLEEFQAENTSLLCLTKS